MKKIILTVVLAVGAFAAQAQDKKFEFGVKAGANLATLAGDFEEATPMAGFHIGGLAEYHLTPNFSVQPELLLSLQGSDSDIETNEGEATIDNVKIGLMYLNMPVLAKYHFSKVPGLSVGLGPQVGLLLDAEQTYDVTVGGDTDEETVDLMDDTKKIDISAVADVEYKLNFGLFFSARYALGLTDINDDGSSDKAKNSVFSVSAGYRF